MKKNLFALVAFTFAMVSCSQDDLSSTDNKNKKVNTSLQAIAPMEDVEITVPSGQVAVLLTEDGDTVAIVPETTEITLPVALKGNSLTAANKVNGYNIKVNYIAQSQVTPYEYKQTYYETVVFEDKDADDYDYNDLVFQVKLVAEDGHMKMDIQPIAYGATYDIELYCNSVVYQKKAGKDMKFDTLKVCDNVRKELFADQTSNFINTDENQSLRHYGIMKHIEDPKKKINKNENIDISWTIKVKNTGATYTSIPMTQRVASGKENGTISYNNLYSADNIPFGLVFTDIYGKKVFGTTDNKDKFTPCGANWFFYPAEHQDIETVYPNFRKWLENGEKANFKWYSPVGKYINVVGDGTEKSLYDMTSIKAGQYETVSRKNIVGFDQSQYLDKMSKK